MSTVIIYMSLHSCAEKAALLLKELSWEKVDLVNLSLQDPPELDNYKTVIIGGSIHMGTIQGKITRFCNEHEWEMVTKRLGLYLCHMHEGDDAIRQFNNAFSKPLRDHAIAKGLFGGEFNLDKMTRNEKMLIKQAVGVDHNIANVNTKAIEGFGRVIFHLDKS